jgi:hypothetical protein
MLAESRDGGITFLPSRKIIDIAPAYFKVEGVERANGFPQIAVDPRNGRLFVSWSDYRNGDVDIFCATSNDRGRTWTRPVRVNTDPVHNGSDQFFQWLAVDPSDGSADIVFYDRRDDPDNRRAIVVLARSTNGGQSFTNYSWSDRAFDPGDQFIGDYTALTALNGRVYGAWTETVSTAGMPRARATTKSTVGGAKSTLVRIAVADFQTPGQPTPQ